MIIVNFKNYNPLKYNIFSLSFSIKELNEKYGDLIYLSVPSVLLPILKDVPLITQEGFHSFGSYTGKTCVETFKEFTKIKGFLLNHSENQMYFNDLIKTIKKIEEIDSNLIKIVCADSEESSFALNSIREILKIEYIAYEPPELIGGDISVSKAKPEIIERITSKVDNLLVGAGIKKKEDVKRSLELGAKGILVASGVVKAKNPYKILEEFVVCF